MEKRRRSSLTIQRVFVGALVGVATLPMVGCSDGNTSNASFDPGVDLESRSMNRKMYTSKEDCLADWGNDAALCEETRTTSPSGHSLVYFHGPYYSGSSVYVPHGSGYAPYQGGNHSAYSGFTSNRSSSVSSKSISTFKSGGYSSARSGGFGSTGSRAGGFSAS